MIMPEKYQTIVKDSVLQNDLAGNCDDVWNVSAKNKQPPEGVKTQMRKIKGCCQQKKKISKKVSRKAMASFNENDDTKNMSISV